jgi:hypothetical protein
MVELVYGHLNDATLTKAIKVLPKIEVPAPLLLTEGPGDKGVTASSVPVTNKRNRRKAETATPPSESTEALVPRDGIEPSTRGFSVRCSTS